MHHFNSSAQLTEIELGEIKARLDQIRSRLPARITLTSKERRRMFKMGDKSVAFVENCRRAAENHPDMLVSGFDVAAFARVVDLAAALSELRMEIDKLAAEIDDTTMAVRAEALDQSREVYGYIKISARQFPGLKAVAERLGTRFARPRRNKEAAAPIAEDPQVAREVPGISVEPATLSVTTETLTRESGRLNDEAVCFNDAAPPINGDARSCSGEPLSFNRELRELDDAAPRCNGESAELNDDTSRCNDEFYGLGDEPTQFSGKAGSPKDEARRLNHDPRRENGTSRRGNQSTARFVRSRRLAAEGISGG